MRALSSAQQPIVDETNNDWSENDETLSVGGDRYQIVNSRLPVNGDYQIAKRMYFISTKVYLQASINDFLFITVDYIEIVRTSSHQR